MKVEVLLSHELCKAPEGILFQRIVGIPLFLRNILALKKAGIKTVGVLLPARLAIRYHEMIAPQLEKRGIHVSLVTYEKGTLTREIQADKIIPTNCLVEEKLASPFFKFIVDDVSQIKEAEKILTENIRLSTPGPVAKYLNKRISLPISLRLAKWNIHPNWITLLNLGISTGFFVAQGSYKMLLMGAALFQCASIFDGCDGEVAKLNFTTSKFGQYFDSISDNGALISFFVGLIFAFSNNHGQSATVGMATLLLGGLGGLLWQMIQFLKRFTHSASLVTFDKEYLSKLSENNYSPVLLGFIRYGKILMRKDCFSLYFLLAALIGTLPWLLYLSIAGLWIANGILLYLKLQPFSLPKATSTYE